MGVSWRAAAHRLTSSWAGRHWRALGRYGKLAVMMALLIVFNITWYLPLPTHAAGPNMYLFWDPTAGYTLPGTWSVVSSVDGYFPRGVDKTDLLNEGGFPNFHEGITRPAQPPVTSVTIGAPSLTVGAIGGSGIATSTHTHPSPSTSTVTVSPDFSSDSSHPDIPVFRSLQLIKYGNGIPDVIPAGAIAMFDQAPTNTPFTAYSANDNKMIRIDSAVATGGSDTQTNTITIPKLASDPNAPQVNRINIFGSQPTAIPLHTHNAPTALNCNSGCSASPCSVNDISNPGTETKFDCTQPSLPPYVSPMLYQATSDTPTLSIALTAMFDSDPGGGWQIVSATGKAYNGMYLRPAPSADLSVHGTDTRPGITVSGTSGTANGGSTGNTLGGNGTGASQDHTHTVTISTGTVTNDNDPPYFDIIIAQKVSFVLQAYRWYVDPPTATGTDTSVGDAWPSGTLDLPTNTGLPAVPAPYQSTSADEHTQLRLRVQILVSAQALPADTIGFKLQYAKTSYNDCTTSSDTTWQDVPDNGTPSVPWTYGSNNVTDNSAITPVLGSNVGEVFSKSNSVISNPTGAATGETIEYDWLIEDTGATGGTQYAFRPVEYDIEVGNEVLLSYYGTPPGHPTSSNINTTCPIIITRPSTEQELRHGEFFQTNPYNGSGGGSALDPDQGFVWVN